MKVLFEPTNALMHPIGVWIKEQSNRANSKIVEIESVVFDTSNVFEQCLFQLLEGVTLVDNRPTSTTDRVQSFQIDELEGVIILSPTGDTIIVSRFYDPLKAVVRSIIAYSGCTEWFALLCHQLELDPELHLPSNPYYVNEDKDQGGMWYQTRYDTALHEFNKGNPELMIVLVSDALARSWYTDSSRSEHQALEFLHARDDKLVDNLRAAQYAITQNLKQESNHTEVRIYKDRALKEDSLDPVQTFVLYDFGAK